MVPKKSLETNISKSLSSRENLIWQILSRIIECNKPQETIYKGPTGSFDNYCGGHRINFVTPTRLLKTQISQKKAVLPMEKFLRQCFFVLSMLINLNEQT